MKIRLEIDESITENEVVIRCGELSEEILALQRRINESSGSASKLEVMKGDTSYYLELRELMFFETAGNFVAVHTANEIFTTKQKLYELEGLLPRNFIRVSKSTIINVNHIRAIHKNLTGASDVEFIGSLKKAYISRNYLKTVNDKIEEMRLK